MKHINKNPNSILYEIAEYKFLTEMNEKTNTNPNELEDAHIHLSQFRLPYLHIGTCLVRKWWSICARICVLNAHSYSGYTCGQQIIHIQPICMCIAHMI